MAPFRFLHSADWQIGMKADHVGAAAEKVREARFAAARRVVELANERGVDALLLTGDTFEDTAVPRALVQRIVDILRGSHAPVFVLPGNHDPLVPGGVFEHPAWRDAEPLVRVLRSGEAIAIGSALLLACPIARRTSPEDPTDALASCAAAGELIRIGIAHGSLRGGGAPESRIADDFPIDREVVRRAGLDYLALGHWHVPSQHEVDGVARVAYSGAHEPTKFGEESQIARSGQCVLVEIDAPGAAPRIESIATACLTWRQERRELANADDLARIRAEIDAQPASSRESVLLDLVLTGTLDPSELRMIDDLATLANERFLYARIRSDDVAVRPTDERWIDALPPGVPQAVARQLVDALSRPADSSAARGALDLLYQLARESPR